MRDVPALHDASATLLLSGVPIAGQNCRPIDILALTTEIVSAYIANNTVEAGGVAALIQSVFEN